MKLLFKSITAAILILTFYSCSKNKEVYTVSLIKKSKLLAESSIKFPMSSSTTSYQYNKNNLLAVFLNGDFKHEYVYKASTILYSITQVSASKKIYQLELTRNTKGLITEGKGLLLYNPSAPIEFSVQYEYDATGYLIKQVTEQQNRVMTKEFTYTNGDLTQLRYSDNGQLKYTVTYKYENKILNKFNIIQFADFPVPVNSFAGKTSKHLWDRADQVNTDGLKGYTAKTFTLDNEGYPVNCVYKSSNIVFTEYYSFTNNK